VFQSSIRERQGKEVFLHSVLQMLILPLVGITEICQFAQRRDINYLYGEILVFYISVSAKAEGLILLEQEFVKMFKNANSPDFIFQTEKMRQKH
jgi:hypothetical protein